MAASPYRQMITEVVQQLDDAATENLAHLFGFTPAQKSDIRGSPSPGLSLVEKLEQSQVMTESDVSGLIEGLKAVRLIAAAEIAEDYMKIAPSFLAKSGKESLCSEHKAELGFYCFNCDNGVCYQCFLDSHEKHDVITMETVEQEHDGRYEKNLSLITESKLFLKSARDSLYQMKQYDHIRLRLFDFSLGSKALEPVHVSSLISLERNLDSIEDLLKRKETSLKLSSQTTKMLPLHRVKMQNEITKQIRRIGKDVSQLKGKLESSRSAVVGINWPLTNQIILVYDKRMEESNGITLSCINPKKLSEIYFEFSIKCDMTEKFYPVVVSPITYWQDGVDHILVAAGQTVYICRLHFKGDKYVRPKGQATSQRLVLPSGSYITSVDAHNRSSSRKHEFIVTINSSAEIYRFNAKLNKVGVVDVSDVMLRVDVASCTDSIYAAVDSSKNSVILIEEREKGCAQVGELVLKDHATDVHPMSVLWRGTAWLVLWIRISGSRDARWFISVHDKEGKFMFCSKSEKFSESDFPICFSRFEFDIALAMSSGTMRFCSSKEGQINWASCFDF